MKWIIAGVVALAAAVAIAAVVSTSNGDVDSGQVADVAAQGGEGEPLAADGGELERSPDRLRMRVTVPTPEPGTYEYPTGDMVGPDAAPHPDIVEAGPGEREVFTLWVFVFNQPELCTDGSCDADDVDEDAAARGGVYQTDGRIAEFEELVLSGTIRLGQPPLRGSALDNPEGAEVHTIIVPHGRALDGTDLIRQLNSPVGNPTLWWAATFSP